MLHTLNKQQQKQERKVTPDDFVIKKGVEPVIWNVYVVAERRIDGYTKCNFLCPMFQDLSKLRKESFTDGFLVKSDELIPSYMVDLYVINPAFEIDILLQKGNTPESLPERLQPFYDFYSKQVENLEKIEQNIPENDVFEQFTSDPDIAYHESRIKQMKADESENKQMKANETNDKRSKDLIETKAIEGN